MGVGSYWVNPSPQSPVTGLREETWAWGSNLHSAPYLLCVLGLGTSVWKLSADLSARALVWWLQEIIMQRVCQSKPSVKDKHTYMHKIHTLEMAVVLINVQDPGTHPYPITGFHPYFISNGPVLFEHTHPSCLLRGSVMGKLEGTLHHAHIFIACLCKNQSSEVSFPGATERKQSWASSSFPAQRPLFLFPQTRDQLCCVWLTRAQSSQQSCSWLMQEDRWSHLASLKVLTLPWPFPAANT